MSNLLKLSIESGALAPEVILAIALLDVDPCADIHLGSHHGNIELAKRLVKHLEAHGVTFTYAGKP